MQRSVLVILGHVKSYKITLNKIESFILMRKNQHSIDIQLGSNLKTTRGANLEVVQSTEFNVVFLLPLG